MAEDSESINELKTEIAGSRQRLSRELQGLRYELDFPAKFRRSFRKQTGSWISAAAAVGALIALADRKSTRLNSSHSQISYAVFCLKKKKKKTNMYRVGITNVMICST